GSLVQVTAGFGLLAFLGLEALRLLRKRLRREPLRPSDLRASVLAIVTYSIVGLVGLYLLDLRFTEFRSPLDHLARMFGYGLDLQTPVTAGITSQPWQWIVGLGSFDYLRVDVNSFANGQLVGSSPVVEFQGAIS